MKVRYKKLYSKCLVEELSDIISHFYCNHTGGNQELIKEAKDVIDEIVNLLNSGC